MEGIHMKKILAALMAFAMTLAFVTPAFAASLSKAEEDLLAEFKTELEYWGTNAGLDQAHINQYYGQAQSALTALDLSDDACAEFSGVIKKCHSILEGSTTRAQLYSHVDELLSTINPVGAKYYELHVTVNAKTKNATVTYKVGNKTSTAASSSSTVKQTGFGLAQTAAVAGVSLAVLAGAFVVARKKQLFVA